MERVSCKMFFSVLWRGICQVLGWFFGLFGYKREGKFAKCVWGLFSVSAAIFMSFVACFCLYGSYVCISRKLCHSENIDTYGQYVSRNIWYHADYNGDNGYLEDRRTGEKIMKGIAWIAKPLGNDSLVCYSNGKLRGYFNAKNGKVIIEPKYKHAWIFSDGLAAIEEDGLIKFIDCTGKVVLDKGISYNEYSDDYVFHGGYLVVSSDDRGKCGLMDKNGTLVLPAEYDEISVACNLEYWRVRNDVNSAVYDKNMKIVLPFIEGNVFLYDNTIDVTMADHTMRKYDYSGNLIDDFYITSVMQLEYETDELYHIEKTKVEDEDECYDELEPWQHKRAIARLRSYVAGDGYEGLMTPEGHVVTMPLYQSIEAIGHDTYLCTVSNGDKLVVDGKGTIIR